MEFVDYGDEAGLPNLWLLFIYYLFKINRRVVILVIQCIKGCLFFVGRTETTELVLCTVSAIMQFHIDAVLSLTQRRINCTVFPAR